MHAVLVCVQCVCLEAYPPMTGDAERGAGDITTLLLQFIAAPCLS